MSQPMPTFTIPSLLTTMTIPLLVILVYSKLASLLPLSFGVTILFPYRSILLIVHSRHLFTWRGSVRFLNTAYLLVRSSSTFSLVSLSSDVLIS